MAAVVLMGVTSKGWMDGWVKEGAGTVEFGDRWTAFRTSRGISMFCSLRPSSICALLCAEYLVNIQYS